jgi:hypothetical protein
MCQIKLLLATVSLSLTLSTLFVNFTSPRVLAETVSFVASNDENLDIKQTKNRNFNSKDFSQNVQRWQDYDRKLQEQRDRQWQNNKRQWQDYNWRLQQRNTPQEWSNDYRQRQNQQQRSQSPDSDYNRQWQQHQQQWQNYHPQWDSNPQWQDYYRQ